jgi:ACS family hexuronate transporter-like MFS transporter
MRWVIVGLLFFATTINYLDRAVLGVILPEIRDKFHFGLPVYGAIQMVFQLAYAGGSLLGGRLLDRYGTRVGYGIAAAVWSLAATLNAFAGSAFQFGLFRTVLGFGESANFPACSKAAAEWFPPNERATAMGIVNAGTNLANIFGPPLFILIALTLGWQACFAIMGGLGFLWLPFWFLTYRLPKQAGAATALGAKLSIGDVMKYKQAWGYGLAKFLTDPVWWFYLFWLPTYLTDVRHFTPQRRGGSPARRYCFQFSDEARVDSRQGAQDDAAVLRGGHAGMHAGRRRPERAIRGPAVWPRNRGPSGLDDESFYHARR